MVSVLHGNAKTTPKIREEIQNSKESIALLAERFSLNPKTVMKWRHAGRTVDKRAGPKQPKSVLSTVEQHAVCEFRRVTKLPLDDCYIALKNTIPTLSRSNLNRCLKRNGLNRLPVENEEKKARKKFKEYTVGFVHIDITELRVGKQKWYLFVAIDRCSKYVYVELHERMSVAESVDFLQNLMKDCPFKITKILTDNGAQFTYALLAEHLKPKDKIHPFDALCVEKNIEHRLTKFKHPWTNGQVEITNKMLKNNTVKQYHYNTAEQLKYHLMTFVLYYNHQKKLKSLNFISPYDKLIETYKINPELFHINPCHKIVGLNS